MISAAMFALLVGVASAFAAPVPKEDDAARVARIYGSRSDPDTDAQFGLTDEKLRIVIPARPRPPVLNPRLVRPADPEHRRALEQAFRGPNPGPRASARVWREVTGDFTAVVRVAFPIRAKAVELYEKPDRAAGLVAWSDDVDHVGVARVEEQTENGTREAFHLILDHDLGVRLTSGHFREEAEAGFVRLIRKGKNITTAYSRDGRKWTDLSTDNVDWKETVKVGVYVKNLSDAKLVSTFDEYKLTQPKK